MKEGRGRRVGVSREGGGSKGSREGGRKGGWGGGREEEGREIRAGQKRQ